MIIGISGRSRLRPEMTKRRRLSVFFNEKTINCGLKDDKLRGEIFRSANKRLIDVVISHNFVVNLLFRGEKTINCVFSASFFHLRHEITKRRNGTNQPPYSTESSLILKLQQ